MVLAGSYKQYVQWQTENPDKDGSYVTSSWQLKGHRGYEVVRFGTWQEREHLDEIEAELEYGRK